MTKRIKIVALMVVGVFILSSSTFAFANTSTTEFKDVGSDHWAFKAINWMVSNNFVSGYPDGNFKPDNAVTRAEFAKVMVSALNLPISTPKVASFRDVNDNHWAFRYIESAKPYLTWYSGYQGDSFKPSEPAQREDMAVALVKALKLKPKTEDEKEVDIFYDKEDISPNLLKYIGIAVKNDIIKGYQTDGRTMFNPKDTLTRAQTAALLYNTIRDEKVTSDGTETKSEEKVTQDPSIDYEKFDTSYSIPVVDAKVVESKIRITWNEIDDQKLQGYKVVISKNNSAPKYPDDGYLYWITDKEKTYADIDNTSAYNGGDIGKYLIPGQSYYFSITAVYSNTKVPGNVVNLTYPLTGNKGFVESSNNESSNSGVGYTTPNVVGKVENGKVLLSWQKIMDEGFQGYKVVISKNNSQPKYPNDGYLYWITDREKTSATVETFQNYNGGDINGKLIQGQSYYFSVTAVYGDKKVPGNVINMVLP